MSIFNRLKSFQLLHLSRPVADRPLYQAIHGHGFRRLVEVGIASTERTLRLIEAATLSALPGEVHYVGIDLFEAGGAQGGLGLKDAYRLLRPTGARVQLIPGDPTALMQHANALGQIDLLLLSARSDWEAVSRLWFYVPRLLHAGSQIFVERIRGGQIEMELLGRSQFKALVAAANARRAA